ncbi:MAG: chromosomal replication initiator protein DnaA, partial [Sporomusaceae bacterium]|nr:chromosomal replication initiator protein DnaA [Sporomusaceae bacterium]
MADPNLSDLADVWQKALQYLEKNLTTQIYDTWIKSTIPLAINDNSIELGVAKSFVKEWLENRYLTTFKEALHFATGKDFSIIFTNLDLEEKKEQPASAPDYSEILDDAAIFPVENEKNDFSETNSTVNNKKEVKEVYDTSYPLNPKFTFATFVPGNSNRLAHAASRSVAEKPAKAYNPFFIYGNSGLGKTHLMHAIGNSIRETFPHMKVVYISSETFTNEFINSIRNNSIENFRQRYRVVDVLL